MNGVICSKVRSVQSFIVGKEDILSDYAETTIQIVDVMGEKLADFEKILTNFFHVQKCDVFISYYED